MTNFGPLCEKLITGIVINTKQPLFLWLSSRPALGSIINELLTVQVQKMESDYGSRWLDAPAYYIMLLVVISQNAFIFNFLRDYIPFNKNSEPPSTTMKLYISL